MQTSAQLWAGIGIVLALGTAGLGAQDAKRFDPAREPMKLVTVGNGFGQLLPHRVPVPDAQGLPTSVVVDIRTQGDLANVRPFNPILPTTVWPAAAVLPDGRPGNHYIVVRFGREIDVDSVLTDSVGALSYDNLTGAIQVFALEQLSSTVTAVRGRAFIGGRTYGAVDPADPTRLRFEQWVELDGAGRPRARTIDGQQPGLGFPGTQSPSVLPGARGLLDDQTFVFVVDSDHDLSTFETFPAGRVIALRIDPAVRSRFGVEFGVEARATGSVGADTHGPEVLGGPFPVIEPADGDRGVDPETHVFVSFTEAVQPLVLGPLDPDAPPGLSAAIQLVFGPAAARVQVPVHVRLPSVLDLLRVELVPAYPFPGSGGAGFCTSGQVQVRVNSGQVQDLVGNTNALAVQTAFQTAAGQGLVNAPVAPDTIYVARGGALSVIDLNGFGQSTGDPTFDLFHPIVQGNSNFPNNPNVMLQGSQLTPPLVPGTCTFDGGSAGVFTLTRDSNLGDELIGAPALQSVGDMALGHALDSSFNDALPSGCQAGGGNLCASTGLKRLSLAFGGPNTLVPATGLAVKIVVGGENPVSWAPTPNPPGLAFPPLCLQPFLLGQEPTSIVSALPPPQGSGLFNLLAPGPNPLGNPALDLPPTNLLAGAQNAFFQGPSPAQPSVLQCQLFGQRQHIGHFLYVVDRVAEELVVLDSNRFTVLDRLALADPTSLAMSPNLDLLAVSQEGADQVSFVDIDPSSASFHQVVHTTAVGRGPVGLAWDSGNEDVLVCNRGAGSVSVISAFTLEVRKTVQAPGKVRALDGRYLPAHFPFEVALTPRQLGLGFNRGVYFGYILNTDGTLSVFESGPDGVNGWGYDDIVDTLSLRFHDARTLQPDVTDLGSAVFVLHEDPLGLDGRPTGQTGGALTKLAILSGASGVQVFTPAELAAPPHLRQLQFGVEYSLGEGPNGLSGVPVDLAFDDQLNLSALTNFSTQFSAGQPLSFNGKSLVRFGGSSYLPASAPALVFLAVPGATPSAGAVDVIQLASRQRRDADVFQPGIQSIAVPGVSGLMDYFRQ